MSAIFSESWFAYGKYNGDDAFDPAAGGANQARAAHGLNIARGGYSTYFPANTSADTSGGLVVRADSVYPSRNAVTHSSAVTSAVSLGVSAAFRKRLPPSNRQIIIGFGVYVPGDYVPNVNNSTVPVLRIACTLQNDATWQNAVITPIYSAKEAFRITNDLSIRWGTDAAQSSRKLKVGAMNYMELRISPGEVSVWIDDTFVMQKIVSLVPDTVAFIFENNVNAGAGGTNMSGTPGRWQISNMYYLTADGVAPYQRLGPTTRVIGSRPDADIDVRFIRPVEALTNASVAAQDLVDAPSQALQSTTVGDFDTYGSAQAAADIRTMGMVHAVATKVLAQNLEPDIHRIKPYLKFENSGEGADTRPRDLVQMTGTGLTRTIRAMAIRPSDHTIWAVGDAESIWRSGPNYDTSTWTKLRDTGSAVNYMYIYFDAAGNCLLSCSDNMTDWVLAGSDIINLGTTAYPNGIGQWGQSPDGSRYVNFTTLATGNFMTWTLNPFVASPAFTNLSIATNSGPVGGGFSVAVRGGLTNERYMGTFKNATGFVVVAIGAMNILGNYTGIDTGDATAAYNAVTWDGAAWLIGAMSNEPALNGGPRIRRGTPDGTAWAPATPIGSGTAGANGVLRAAASNTATQESVMVGDSGAVVVTSDGLNWRQMPRLVTTALYACLVLPSGDFLIGGAAGVLLTYKAFGADTPLYPLAGYTMTFGSAVFNPKTAAPWTPDEAADSFFGVRLTT